MAPRPAKSRYHLHHHHHHPCVKRKRKKRLPPYHHAIVVFVKRDAEPLVVVAERGLISLTAMSAPPLPATTTTTTPTTTTTAAPTKDQDEEDGVVVEGAEAVEVRGRRKLENADSSYDSDFDPNDRVEEDQHGDVCRTVSDTLGAEFAEYVTKYSHSTPSLPPASSTTTTTTTTTTTPLLPPLSSSKSTKSDSSVTTTTTASTTTLTTTTTTDTTTSTTTPTTTTTTTTTSASSSTTTTTTTTKDTSTSTTTSTTTLPTVTLTQPIAAPTTEVTGGCGVPSVTTVDTPGDGSAVEVPTGTVNQRPTYASQVEFGIKLGYSEALVQLALIKLGATPDKDDLLAELIRLGTTLPKASDGSAGGDADDKEEFTASTDHHKDEHHLLHVQSHHQHPGQDQPQQQTQQTQQQQQQQSALRPVIIDGSNVAMSHGNKTTFSCRGLRVCVEWFRARGHSEITVFVPAWRKETPRWDTPIAEREVLLELERERVLVFTPSRVCGGKRIVSYDDRYILKEAVTSGGVVVSNDNYRDLVTESPGFRRVVEESLLMYSWVNGRFVPPDDPLGRSGPTLEVFLRRSSRDKDKQAPCPYGRKCTYGNKCKYKHPERGTAPFKSVTERLQEQAQRHRESRDSSPGEGLRGSLSLPVCMAEPDVSKKPLARTQSIVPTVSLTLPSSLTQETPTHDNSPTTPAPVAPSHHHLRPPPLEAPRALDPLRSATIYKSDSALYHLYPSQHPNLYGSSAWGWEGGQGAPPQGQPGPYGSHMPLAKQQSDPDPQDNPHRKLQRQLTLNPSYDSRLYKIYGFREPAPEHFPLGGATPTPTQGQQGSPSRVGRGSEGAVFSQGQGRASPGYSSTQYSGREQVPGGLHAPLARHSSQDGGKHLTSLPPHLYPSYSHPHVTRFASAPDPIWGGPHQQAAAPPLITRLNSTSDTRLNLYASDPHYFHDVYEDPLGRPTTYAPVGHPPGPSPGPVTPAPGPVGSRPMSPQGAPLHHSPSVSPRGHTPPQQAPGAGPPPPTSSFPPPGHEDTRLRVFYHLSQLFPEAQVRAVMALHPEETDPQKICGYILAAAGQGSSRPMSPQHQQAPAPPPASPYLLQAFPAGPLTASASQEDARLRAFYHLSQLFPEAEVRAVLARAPDETDTQQFCAALLARRAASQS